MSPRRKRLLIVAGVVLATLAGLAVAAYFLFREPSDVSNPDVEFTVEATTTAAAPPPKPRTYDWPLYGLTPSRIRAFQEPKSPAPPFRQQWQVSGEVLLEFPPALEGDTLYQLNDGGMLRAFDKRTGKVRWRHKLGSLAASTPAVGGGVVYVTILERSKGANGRAVALRTRDGKILWSKDLGSRSESSPLLYDGKLAFGTEGGTVYALSARTGKTLWTYQAAGAVKGGPALANGNLYFGDYGGQVQAVRAQTGKRVWSTGTNGGSFGRSGTFYSTAALRFGRVYLGNTDGRMYSFAQRDGELAWATRTGNYVYAAPVVANVPGLGPTAFAGSYDGSFYAFDAQSGSVRWSYDAGGRISGGGTLVGNVVYFAELGNRRTIGLDARTGKKVFTFPKGGFDPVITDGRWLFLTGYTSLHALVPVRQP